MIPAFSVVQMDHRKVVSGHLLSCVVDADHVGMNFFLSTPNAAVIPGSARRSPAIAVRRTTLKVPTGLLVVPIIVVQFLDVLTTCLALNRGHIEANPVSAFLLNAYGPVGLVVAKVAITAFICVNVIRLRGGLAVAGAAGSVAIVALAVASNLRFL